MKKSFILYLDQYEPIKGLSSEQKGQLLDAMFAYHNSVEFAQIDPLVKLAFSFFKQTFDRDNAKWLRVIERNKENGKKGGRPKGNKKTYIDDIINKPKEPTGLNGLEEKPKKAVSVSVSVSDNVSESDMIVIDKTQIEFDSFWDAFKKKQDKDKCLKKWKKLTKKEKDSIFQCVPSYVKSTPDPQYRKNPLTWLNGKCWNDEIVYKLNPAEQRLKQNIETSKEWINGQQR